MEVSFLFGLDSVRAIFRGILLSYSPKSLLYTSLIGDLASSFVYALVFSVQYLLFLQSYRTVPLRHGPVREPISIVNGGADKAAAKDPVAAESTPTEEMKSDVSDIHHYAQAVSEGKEQLNAMPFNDNRAEESTLQPFMKY